MNYEAWLKSHGIQTAKKHEDLETVKTTEEKHNERQIRGEYE